MLNNEDKNQWNHPAGSTLEEPPTRRPPGSNISAELITTKKKNVGRLLKEANYILVNVDKPLFLYSTRTKCSNRYSLHSLFIYQNL